MAAEEMAALEEEKKQLEADIQLLLLPKDPNDNKSVILEIRAGTGGDESALFAGDLFRMYSALPTPNAGRLRSSLPRNRSGAVSRRSSPRWREKGSTPNSNTNPAHTVSSACRKPRPRAHPYQRLHSRHHGRGGRCGYRHQPGRPEIDVYRSSGAGGQHVNTTDSAVRITHIPTGTVVACQEERSQIKNRAKAMKVLKTRILDNILQEQNAKLAADRKQQVGSGDRSERIRTYNFPQGRMTDHRIGLTLYRLDSIMAGDINEIADALRAYYQMEALKAQSEG